MTVRTVAHYEVHCDATGCDASHRVGPVKSTLAARVQAGRDGWQFTATRYDNGGTRHRDLCPNEPSEAT